MAAKKKGLGRGLGQMGVNELLGQIQTPVSVSEPSKKESTSSSQPLESDDGIRFQRLAISKLKPGPFQPRKSMDQGALQELATSIRSQGIIQPIVVRQAGDAYEIIAGERRWRAAQLAECDSVPVIVRDLPDQTLVAMALIENIQRQDLNVIEEAMALKRLIEEFSMTHQDVAKAVGRSRAAVTNLLRLLKCHPQVRELVEQGKLDMGHARALLALPEAKQITVAKVIVSRSLSVRQTEQLIQRYLHQDDAPAPKKRRRDPNVLRFERDLSERLGADVAIKEADNKAGGRLVISYHSLAELEGIMQHILPEEIAS